ncbi:type III secretion system export apparatus subunit SctS [Pseudomonas batumici]|uniref:type III secretion system export apparatus subunit SctS n=1 Tax=Pseudomonas batumici TaxID=226910 RepID=UPI0030D46D91
MENLVFAGNQALYLILILSAGPILVATVVGLLVAIVQAVTHMQEQTLPFGIKLLAVCLVLYLMRGWLAAHLLVFTNELLRMAFVS